VFVQTAVQDQHKVLILAILVVVKGLKRPTTRCAVAAGSKCRKEALGFC
jgi:hypothetical protein